MSTHRGAVGQLSEHDGQIIEVFTPRHLKIICPAPGENPQHTDTHMGAGGHTAEWRIVPASLHFHKV